MAKKKTAAKRETTPETIKFNDIKSNAFRVIHADGAFGGVSPDGGAMDVSFFSERRPIPTQIIHELGPGSALGKEIERVSKDGIVREVEVAVTMDLATAKKVRDWLDDRITALEQAIMIIRGRASNKERQR